LPTESPQDVGYPHLRRLRLLERGNEQRLTEDIGDGHLIAAIDIGYDLWPPGVLREAIRLCRDCRSINVGGIKPDRRARRFRSGRFCPKLVSIMLKPCQICADNAAAPDGPDAPVTSRIAQVLCRIRCPDQNTLTRDIYGYAPVRRTIMVN
jgi:hypothetical protein